MHPTAPDYKTVNNEVVRVRFNNLIMGCLVALVMMVVSATTHADISRDAIEERLKPVGDVCLEGDDCGTAAQAASDGEDGSQSGEEIYGDVCASCHDNGTAGAPALDDDDAWAERTEQGIETLYDHAINGIGSMPPKGGNSDLSDNDVKRAVNHMVENHMDDVPEVGGDDEDSTDNDEATEDEASSNGDDDSGNGEDDSSNGEEEGGTDEEESSNGADDGNGEASDSDDASGDGGSDVDGEAVYADVCAACHDSGAAGAPKLGDADGWGDRLDQDTATLYEHAINGIGAMPPKGGNSGLSDEEVEAAVDYMIEETE